MAANYKVNIELDTKKLDKQLKDLGVKVDKVGKVKQGQGKKQLSEAEAALKLQQQETKEEIKQIQLRNQKLSIETGIKKVKSQMAEIDKTENQLSKARNNIDAKEFDLAKKELLLSKEDLLTTNKKLAAEKKVTLEKIKQVNMQSAGMNLIRLSGRAGRLGGRAAAVVDQQTALRQPRGLPSAAMLNAEARGIKRLIPERLTDAGNIRGEGYIASSTKKAAFFEDRINKARLRGIENNKDLIGSEVLRNKQTLRTIKATEQAANAEARRLNQALRNPLGPSSPLNYRGNQLLPGPAGSGRGGGLTSALIRGAFPLLFGQGPLAAAGGFTGGLVGDRLGGQMGGFAGGLIGTAVVTGIQNAVTGVANLGKALDPLTADINKLTTALGLAGTEEGRRIKLIEQLNGKQAALAAVTQNMVDVVGERGVREIRKFGESFTALGNSFQRFLLRVGSTLAEVANRVGALIPGDGPETPNVIGAIQRDPIVKELEAQIAAAQKARIEREDMRILPKGFGGMFPTELPDVNELSDFAIQQAQLENLQKQLEARKKIVKNQEIARAKTANNVKQADLLLKSNLDNIVILRDTLEVGKEEAIVRQKIRDLAKVIGEEEAKTQETRIRTNLQLERSLRMQVELAETIGQTFKDGFKEAITGANSFGEAMRNVLNRISDKLLDMAIESAFSGGLFKTILGGLGSIFSGGLGDVQGNFMPSNPTFRGAMATGGPVKGGSSYLVGEKGPEMFTPGVSGTITPNNALGGSVNVVVNVDASGSSVEGDEQQGRELGLLISSAVQSEIIQQQRPGGLLA